MKNTTNSNPATPHPVPVTAQEAAAAILRPYKAPRELLKEWTQAETGEAFDAMQKAAAAELAHYFGSALEFTAGSRPRFANDFREYEAGDLFGLPYTSSGSDFAALWNTNTEARTRCKLCPPLYFRGIAAQPRDKNARKYKSYDFIYIFNNIDDDYYYFTACEFLTVKKQLDELQRAATLSEFIKDINRVTPQAVEVLKKYNGKKCGEKTRDKIRADIDEVTKATAPALRLWADFSQYSPALRFSYGYNTYKKDIYFNFYNYNDNIIKIDAESPAPLAEFEPVEALQELKKAAEEAQTAAAVLLPLIEAYNEAARRLHLPAISTTGASVSALAKYGAENAANY